MSETRTVTCPQCGTPVPWTRAARWRPFCSERCKLIDLGAWASEAYRVPVRDTNAAGAAETSRERGESSRLPEV
jgi:hypothetical protein